MEVFPIGGGEVGDVVMAQCQGEANIVNAAHGVAGAGVLPDLVHQSGAWVVENEPRWIFPEIVDFLDGLDGSQRAGANDGIAQQGVNLDQDQFAEGKVMVHHHGFQPGAGRAVVRVGNLQRGEKQIRVANNHRGQSELDSGEFASLAAKVGGETPVLICEGIAPELGIGWRLHGPCPCVW